MPGGFDWKKLAPDADYPKLNDRLNGLPDYLRKAGIQPPAPPAATPQDVEYSYRKALISSFPGMAKKLGASDAEVEEAKRWKEGTEEKRLFEQEKLLRENKGYGKVVSGTAGAVSGATFGMPELLAKGKAKEQIQALKKNYPTANTIGNVAGGVAGSFLIPGAGTALAAKGGWMAGKSLLPLLARSGLNAATTAIPSAVSEGLQTGDWKAAAKSGAIGLGVGTAVGAAGEALGEVAKKGYRALRGWLDDVVLKAGGVRSKEVMKVLQGGVYGKAGFTPQKAEALKSEIADAIGKKGLYGKQSLMQFFDDEGKIWNEIDDAWVKAGANVDDFIPAALDHPDVMEHLTSPLTDPVTGKPYADFAKRVADDIFSKARAQKNLPNVRKVLMDQLKQGLKKGDNLGQIQADVAGALRDAIDNAFVPAKLKAEYPALLALKKSGAWNAAAVPRSGGGSPTAPRQLVKQILGGTLAVGGTAGATRMFDPKDPSTWVPAAAMVAGSTLGGAALNNLLPRASAQVMGRLASGARQILPRAAPEILSKLGGMAPALAKAAPRVVSALQPPPEEQPAEGAEPVEAAVTATEAQTPPDQVEAARAKVNPVYREKVLAALQNDWNNTFAAYATPLGITYEQFVDMVGNVTEGFDDPKKTARILFHDPKERDKFLGDYDAALKWKGMDVGGALEAATPTGFIGMGQHPVEEKLAYQNLMDYLAGRYNEGKGANESERKRIEASIKAIANTRKTPAEKKRMIEEMLAGYGMNFEQLASMGLWGGGENA